ncbi:carbohydrate ABC transporter permease [Cognatishimia maritima]|uniref:sn-glycerol-3-phosphate transport system permease protein UgpE n=1 Tax=Cognatishimia maritima TaxID=870908 RepID=A0A1M5QJG0_9RHOB|nr:carbohydrate ABC transporter permease [Cognatishimia maritima]SHH14252.1 lactose/L-arabinose transport system permease protein [Cognatishimia maritima]
MSTVSTQMTSQNAKRVRTRQQTDRFNSLLIHAVLVPVAILWLMPVYMMFIFASMGDSALFSPKILLLPGKEAWSNLVNLQADTAFLRTLFNSVVVGIVYTILSVTLTAMAGWALVRYQFYGKTVVTALILGTMTLPFFVVVIPQFIMIARDFGMANTWVALILPPLFNSLGVLFMRQAFSMLPKELFEAAQVEGVKEWQIFLYVALPLARPMIAALSIILFLHSWNNYLWPLLITNERSMMTAPVALGSLIGNTDISWGSIMMGASLLTAPMLAVFIFLQRHFMAGITAGAVK